MIVSDIICSRTEECQIVRRADPYDPMIEVVYEGPCGAVPESLRDKPCESTKSLITDSLVVII
jgi:hypothetical protein